MIYLSIAANTSTVTAKNKQNHSLFMFIDLFDHAQLSSPSK